jgi:hypothetical protein
MKNRNSMRMPRQPLDIKKNDKPGGHAFMRTHDGKKMHPYLDMGYLLRGRFRIHDIVGSGGFGQIFKASDKVKTFVRLNLNSFKTDDWTQFCCQDM